MKDDKFYLIQIAEDITRLEKFTPEGKNAFMVSDCFLRRLESPYP